jgi:hypothetical protein
MLRLSIYLPPGGIIISFGQIPLVMECFIIVTLPCLKSICGSILYIASPQLQNIASFYHEMHVVVSINSSYN